MTYSGEGKGSSRVRTFLFYLPSSSPFLKINSISKTMMVVTFGILALLYVNVIFSMTLTCILIFLFTISKLGLKQTWKWFILIIWMTVFTVWSYLLLTRIPGSITLMTWPWGDYVTESTVYAMLAQMFRWQALALSSILFLSTVTDSDIIDVLQFFRIPYTASFMLSLTIRSVSMFLGDWTTIKEAMTSKGIDFQTGNAISKVRKQLFVMWPLVYLIFSRVREIAFAIESRGFGSFKKRTRYRVITWNLADWVIIFACIAVIASFVIWHFILGINLPFQVT